MTVGYGVPEILHLNTITSPFLATTFSGHSRIFAGAVETKMILFKKQKQSLHFFRSNKTKVCQKKTWKFSDTLVFQHVLVQNEMNAAKSYEIFFLLESTPP